MLLPTCSRRPARTLIPLLVFIKHYLISHIRQLLAAHLPRKMIRVTLLVEAALPVISVDRNRSRDSHSPVKLAPNSKT